MRADAGGCASNSTCMHARGGYAPSWWLVGRGTRLTATYPTYLTCHLPVVVTDLACQPAP